LRGERSDTERARSTPGREPVNNAWRWLGLLLVLALFSTGAVLIAWQFWQNSERGQSGAVGTSTPTGSASPTSSPTVESGPLPIRHATAFDPSGDGEENDDEASLAIDGDATTQWSTVTYASRNLGGLKPGVGLQLAVSQDQPIGGIELRLDGRGSDLQVWAARPETDPKGAPPKVPPADDPLQGYHKLASVRGASDLVTLRFSPAVTTNRIVVWFTALPAVSDGYRVGVVEATLFS
jgi:putative peptidoglycan lipid II flippase